MLLAKEPMQLLGALLENLPSFAEVERGGKSLYEQFNYRYNYDSHSKTLVATVKFTEQLVINIALLKNEEAKKLEDLWFSNRDKPFPYRKIVC